MEIKDLFEKDITRNISGVIKVDQHRDEEVYQELDEFVITKELRKHFDDFFKNYSSVVNSRTDKIGVWISGFFGSGKSHLLKMISYLLENKTIRGQSTISFFEKKFSDDQMLLAEIKKAIAVQSECILFNIDSKANVEKTSKSAIADVFMKVFNEKLGYYGDIPWIAEFERKLDEKGLYDKFKESYKITGGTSWEEGRGFGYMARDQILDALVKTGEFSKDSSEKLFDSAEKDYTLSNERLALTVKKYLDSKGKNHKLIFLIDEIGQYIGDNSDLMLNLQTVVENLGTYCAGQAWVIVTSQEAIDLLTKDRLKDQDFSKIQGRFDTRLNLSSSNVDEVIKKRLLEKKDFAKDTLTILYKEQSVALANLIYFAPGTKTFKRVDSESEFYETYPFLPYQFNLLQNVFEAIRKFSHAGKHLAEGERSMVNAFHKALIDVGNNSLDSIVPFTVFYNTVEKFLDGNIKRIIDKAASNDSLNSFDVEVLKILFMIKYIQGFPNTVENITTLLVSSLKDDKSLLRSKVESALTRLKKETLIQENGEEYFFLTDEEQDVNRGIKNTDLDFDEEVLPKLWDILFNDIFDERSLSYTKFNIYSLSRFVDTHTKGKQGEDLTIKFVTPDSDEYNIDEGDKYVLSMGDGELLVKPPRDRKYLDEIGWYLKTEKYIKNKGGVNLSEAIEKIIQSKQAEQKNRQKRIQTLLEEMIKDSIFFGCRKKYRPEGNVAKIKIQNALKSLVVDTYNKLSLVEENFDQLKLNNIFNDFSNRGLEFPATNKKAFDDIRSYLSMRSMAHQRTSMKNIKERYLRPPYGWSLFDIAGLVAHMFLNKELLLEFNDGPLTKNDPNLLGYLTKEKDYDRLIVKDKSKLDLNLVSEVKSLITEAFGDFDLGNDDDVLGQKAFEIFNKQVSTLKSFEVHYLHSPYPGKDVVSYGLIKLQELIDQKIDYISFIIKIGEQKIDLLNWAKNYNKVKDFFETNKKKIFDEGLEWKKRYEANKHSLLKAEIKEEVVKLTTILVDTDPYAKIKELPFILSKFKEMYNDVLNSKKGESKDKILINWSLLEGDLKLRAASTEISIVYKKKIDQLLDEVERRTDFNLSPIVERSEQLIAEAYDEMKSQILDRDADVILVKEIVYFKDLNSSSFGFIDTSEDLDKYINKLKSEIQTQINQGKRVKV